MTTGEAITDINNKCFNEKGMSLCKTLLNYVSEIEDNIKTVEKKIKGIQILLSDKEIRYASLEEMKSNNVELFSPIYSKTYDTTDIITEIGLLKNKEKELESELDSLQNKKTDLMEAVQFMDYSIQFLNKKEEKNEDSEEEKDLKVEVLWVLEEERQRIARDLHDSTVQNLTSLMYKTELVDKYLNLDMVRAKLELNTIGSSIKSIINEMRTIIYDLKPMSLDDLGLVKTLERLSKQIMRHNENLEVTIRHNTENKNLLPIINITLYRVIQEACQNIVKHANASKIEIILTYNESDVLVKINDDGIGFDLSSLDSSEQKGKFGVTFMKERIYCLSGTFHIDSKEKKGTIITVNVPFAIKKGD